MFLNEVCTITEMLPQIYVRIQINDRRKEDTKEELQIVDINSRIKCYQIKR
jgi:hypothetical protein